MCGSSSSGTKQRSEVRWDLGFRLRDPSGAQTCFPRHKCIISAWICSALCHLLLTHLCFCFILKYHKEKLNNLEEQYFFCYTAENALTGIPEHTEELCVMSRRTYTQLGWDDCSCCCRCNSSIFHAWSIVHVHKNVMRLNGDYMLHTLAQHTMSNL